MSTPAEEIIDKMDKFSEAATAAQKTADLALEAANDPLIKESAEKAAAAAGEAMEGVNGIKQEMEALKTHSEFLEKQIARMPAGKDGGISEFEQKARDAMTWYLRHKTEMHGEIVDEICDHMAKKTLVGVTPEYVEMFKKTLIAGNNPQGGYWIRPERSAMMVMRIFETSPVRSIANITTTTSDILELVIDDNEATTGGWVGETQSRPDTNTPDIGLLSIPIHEQFAQPKATQKMLDDAGFDIEAWLSRKVVDVMTRFENTAFVVGDGSQKPKGFMALPAWAQNGVYERGAIEQINSGAAGAFTADGVKDLKNALIENYQGNAIFGIKRASFEQIITLKDGLGQYLLDPRSMKVGDTQVLLGKDVIFMNDIADIATDALAMVYGDFTVGYTIVDRLGFRVIRDELTEKPFVKFYTTKRVGGAVTNFQSLKIQKLAA